MLAHEHFGSAMIFHCSPKSVESLPLLVNPEVIQRGC
jgi:hypothetical protein